MWTYNLFEALRRLGVKGARQPDLIQDQVMLALLVGDVSQLAPPVGPPAAWFGSLVPASVGNTGGWSVWSRGAGGCFIDSFAFSAEAANVVLGFAVRPGEDVFFPSPLAGHNMGPTPVQSLVKHGTQNAAALSTSWPRLYAYLGDTLVVTQSFYVPRGSFAIFHCGDLDQELGWSCLVRDVPATPGDV